MADYKTCTKCGVSKEDIPTNFRHRKNRKSSEPSCRDCERIAAKENARNNKDRHRANAKKYREENPDKYKEYMQEYLKEYHPKYYAENKERLMDKQRQYRKGNTRFQKYCQEYYLANKEYISVRNKQWIEDHPDKRIEYNQSYKAKKRDLPADLTVEQWDMIKEHFNHNCAYCGKQRKLTQDHFIPVNSGGGYTITNIIPACKSCNSSKSDKPFEEWYPQQSFYSKVRERRVLDFIKDVKIFGK